LGSWGVALQSGSTDVYVRTGVYNGNIVISQEDNITYTSSAHYLGVFLVSDGGTTLSSINDPSLNINNSAAPINNAVSVPLPATLGLLGLSLAGFGLRRKIK
jgi:hypothetical protein